jgi:hypothetical protein
VLRIKWRLLIGLEAVWATTANAMLLQVLKAKLVSAEFSPIKRLIGLAAKFRLDSPVLSVPGARYQIDTLV